MARHKNPAMWLKWSWEKCAKENYRAEQ